MDAEIVNAKTTYQTLTFIPHKKFIGIFGCQLSAALKGTRQLHRKLSALPLSKSDFGHFLLRKTNETK